MLCRASSISVPYSYSTSGDEDGGSSFLDDDIYGCLTRVEHHHRFDNVLDDHDFSAFGTSI